MRRFVDLHVHSTASDGKLSPTGVVELAERKRLAAVALTDHDTADGVAEAAAAAEGLALRFVPGIELSAASSDGTLHILGLGIDPAAKPMRELTEWVKAKRADRNPQMVAKLQGLGIEVTMAELSEYAGGGIVGRLHMAELLVRKGVAKSLDEAFRCYLGPGGEAYVDKVRVTPGAAMAAIGAAGGAAILAHPVQLRYGNLASLERIVRSLVSAGLAGIEVYHCDHTVAQTRSYLELARKLGLLVSGGSDFHGPAKPEAKLGLPRTPLAAVEQLLAKIGV